jgi:hypothetical protein
MFYTHARTHALTQSRHGSHTPFYSQAFVRCRPVNAREKLHEGDAHHAVAMTSSTVTVTHPERDKAATFDCFEQCFWSVDGGATAGQQAVYDAAAAPQIARAFDGESQVFIAYGQTGTGKTHTMMGPPADPGLIPRVLTGVFQQIDTRHPGFSVGISYLEIYNERIRDLLNADPNEALRVRSGGHIEGLVQEHAPTLDAGMALIARADSARAVAMTMMNMASNRCTGPCIAPTYFHTHTEQYSTVFSCFLPDMHSVCLRLND